MNVPREIVRERIFDRERDEYRDQWNDVASQEFLDYWHTIGYSCSAGTAIKALLARAQTAVAERDAALELTYRTRYGYPLKWALVAEFFWRVEHLPWPGCLHRWGYRMRKASEHRGGSGQGHG
jgi:hypothetical protein